MNLKEDIVEASKHFGIDPYSQPFKPSDLDLKPSNYGSFSDHCSKDETLSGHWSSDIILKVAEKDTKGRPYKYLLIKQ